MMIDFVIIISVDSLQLFAVTIAINNIVLFMEIIHLVLNLKNRVDIFDN